MLSLHEIAMLLVVKNAPCQIGPGRVDLHALLALQLVTVERPVAGLLLARVTPRGDAFLRAIAR